jgi:hypothetical protein
MRVAVNLRRFCAANSRDISDLLVYTETCTMRDPAE